MDDIVEEARDVQMPGAPCTNCGSIDFLKDDGGLICKFCDVQSQVSPRPRARRRLSLCSPLAHLHPPQPPPPPPPPTRQDFRDEAKLEAVEIQGIKYGRRKAKRTEAEKELVRQARRERARALAGISRPPAPVDEYLRVMQVILRQQAVALCGHLKFPLDIFEVRLDARPGYGEWGVGGGA